MESYFNLPHIGELFIEHQFYEVNDEPILFVCKDTAGVRYLCSCCMLYEKWVIAQTNQHALIDLISDGITIRDIFESRSNNVILVSWNGNEYEVSTAVSAEFFPRLGAKLELAYERNGSYHHLLRQELLIQAINASKQVAAPALHSSINYFYVGIPEEPAFSLKESIYRGRISVSEAMQRLAETTVNAVSNNNRFYVA